MSEQVAYDVGPQATGDEADTEEGADRTHAFLDSPWAVGLIGGVGTFLAIYAVMYQLASAVIAAGILGEPEMAPTRRTLAGLTMLASHGGELDLGEEAMGFSLFNVVTTHLSAFATVVGLVIAGYLLVRYLATDDLTTTGKAAANAGGAFLASYVVLSVLLAAVTRWTPGDEEADTTGLAEPETITVSADVSLVLTVGGTVVVFLTLGGLLALYVTFGLGSGRTGERAEDTERLGTDEVGIPHHGEREEERDRRDEETLQASGSEPAQPHDEERASGRTAVRAGVAEPPRRSVDPEREHDPERGSDTEHERDRSTDGDAEERTDDKDDQRTDEETREDIDPRDRYGTDLEK